MNTKPKKAKLTKEDALFALKLFNEKTDRLINSSFIKHIQANKGLKVLINVSNANHLSVTNNLPTQDVVVDAFVLTIRFFIQKKDCSLRKLAGLYSQFPLTNKTVKDFNMVRDALNSEFEKKSSYHLGGKHLTYRNIFQTFIYGGMAHADPAKKIEFDQWMIHKGLADLIALEFNKFLLYFLDCVKDIRNTNNQAIKEIKTL